MLINVFKTEVKAFLTYVTVNISIGKLRQFHRKHRWADVDCAAAFEQHFIYRAPKLTLQNVVENIQATIDYDSDPANYVVAGNVNHFSTSKFQTFYYYITNRCNSSF